MAMGRNDGQARATGSPWSAGRDVAFVSHYTARRHSRPATATSFEALTNLHRGRRSAAYEDQHHCRALANRKLNQCAFSSFEAPWLPPPLIKLGRGTRSRQPGPTPSNPWTRLLRQCESISKCQLRSIHKVQCISSRLFADISLNPWMALHVL
eukprot:scaffold8631_cov108-Isochrysis_galbana.AAC.21